jgi:hypothetical protein
VKKSGVDREYHVFLFEKIILCCKEALLQSATASKKAGKNGSLLKKPPSTVALNSQSAPQKKNTPLLLKGRIFLNNVTRTVPVSPRNSTCKLACVISGNVSLIHALQLARLQTSTHLRCGGGAMTISSISHCDAGQKNR